MRRAWAAFSYQWLRNDTPIAGATSVSYTLGDDDVGKPIKVRVSYTDGAGNPEVLTSAGHRGGGQRQRCTHRRPSH